MEYGILALLVFVAVLYIQTMLSGAENKYLGLIIPSVWFLAGLVWVAYMAISTGGGIAQILVTLILINIPTAIMMGIYRHKRKK